MDAWQRLLDGEAEEWRLLLREEFGGFPMNKSDIRRFQEESASAYDRTQDVQAATGMAQVAMLAEIALQLAKQNELLDRIAKRLEDM